jgi:ATP diphosphatase
MGTGGIEDLRELMRRLRDPLGGCPWDLAQDWRSLVQHTLEEVYELVDAIERDDAKAVREELGDYLFQAVFYAQVADERGLFDLDDVAGAIVAKLLRRHPHVFPDGTLAGRREPGSAPVEAQIKARWEELKQEDRAARAQHGTLDDVPLALPSLVRAAKLQKRAAGVGFDWPAVEGVLAKLEEEIAELRAEIASGDAGAREDELGDLLFSCVNLARHLGLDAETALRGANAKFERRFRALEQGLAREGRHPRDCDAAELDLRWNAVKRAERAP